MDLSTPSQFRAREFQELLVWLVRGSDLRASGQQTWVLGRRTSNRLGISAECVECAETLITIISGSAGYCARSLR